MAHYIILTILQTLLLLPFPKIDLDLFVITNMGDEISPTGNFNKGDYQQDSKWRYATLEMIPARLFDPELIEVVNIPLRVFALMRESVANMSYENLFDKPHILQDHMAHHSIELLDLINQAAKDGWELTDDLPLQDHRELGGLRRELRSMMRQRIIMGADDFQKGEGQQYPKWRYATLEQIHPSLRRRMPDRNGSGVYALFLKKYTNHDYGRTPLRQNPDEINKNIAHRSNGLLNLINQAAKDGWELTDNFPLQEGQRIGGQNCTVIVPMMRQRIN
jgi:hypothetical protein